MTHPATKPLDDVLDTLIDYRGKTPTKTGSGVRLVTAKVIKDGFITGNSFEFVAEDEYDSWMRRGLPRQWDILLTTEAPMGEVAQLRTTERVALAQRVILLRANPKIMDQGFLFQALKSSVVQEELAKRATGTTVLGIKQSELRKILIPHFSLPRQRQIAAVLCAYDDLIENNEKRIRILEEMARSLYREWFVHFRFPGHEKATLVDSPLGMVPKHWQVDKLQSGCGMLADGDWIETKDQGGEGFRLLQVSNIGVDRFVETGNYRYVTKETFERLHCTEIQVGDILIPRMPKPIGRAWLVGELPWRIITAVDVAIMRVNKSLLDPVFCTMQMNEDGHLSRVAKTSGGATRPRITRRDLAALPFLYPPLALQRSLGEFAGPLRYLRDRLMRRQQALSATRDLLLPRLLSGEIDVSSLPAPAT